MLWLTAPLTCGCTMWCLNSTHNRRKSRFLFSLFFFHPAGSHMVLLLFTAWLEKNDLFYLDYQSCYSAIWQMHYIIACWSISPAAQVFDFSALTYGKIRVLWLTWTEILQLSSSHTSHLHIYAQLSLLQSFVSLSRCVCTAVANSSHCLQSFKQQGSRTSDCQLQSIVQ